MRIFTIFVGALVVTIANIVLGYGASLMDIVVLTAVFAILYDVNS